MPRTARLVLAAALMLGAAAPALAAEPSALLKCDGYGRRQTPGEQVGRGLVVLGTLGLFGSAEADNPSARKTGADGVAACTEALTDSRTTGNPVRRAEVLMMRAVRQFELGKFDEALADVKAARAVELTPLVRAHFDRTIGPGITLLEAFIQLSRGNQAEAEALAVQAAQARPWSVYVPDEAFRILQLSPEISPGERALIERVSRIAPNLRPAALMEGAGEWAAAAAYTSRLVLGMNKPGVTTLARLAAQQALAGDNKAAQETLAKVTQEVDELAAKATGTDQNAQTAAQQVARADELVQLARAQLALNEGRLEDAKAALAGRPRWLSPPELTAQVIGNVQAKAGPGAAPGVDPAKIRADGQKVKRDGATGKGILNVLVTFLPRWEDADEAQDYAKQMAPGAKTMQPKPVRDGAATSILTVRVGVSPAYDTTAEALLVAAARAAAAKGQDRFVVLSNALIPGNGRPGVTARLGVIDFVTPADALFAAQAGRAITVAEVEQGLGALYRVPVRR